MLKKFLSIADPQHAYAYDSEAWDTKATVDAHFRMFATYGDGLCQHSGDWSVTTEHLADYLQSMAILMLTDEELTETLVFTLGRRPSAKQIAFAASVIYKESDGQWGKRRFYSTQELKISKSANKEHDKRYSEIQSWCDGSAQAIFRMLVPEYADALQKYLYATAIRDWLLDHDGYMELPAEFLQWFAGDRDKARDLRYAVEACSAIAESYRLRQNANSAIENYRRQVERSKEQAANVA